MARTAGREAPAHRGRLADLRARVRAVPGGRIAWRIAISVIGVAVILLGIVLLPLPGPGWLVIFAGLGVLGTEYEWAARLLTWVREQVRRSTQRVAARPPWFRLLVGLVSVAVIAAVLIAVWLVTF